MAGVNSTGMSVLLTGHRGYIGQVLAQELLTQGIAVQGVDSDFYRPTPSIDHEHFTEQIKDIRDITVKDLRRTDAIIHLAAVSDDASGGLIPEATREVNYWATVQLAGLAKRNGVKRFIFSSTSGVYGNRPDDQICTESAPVSPLSEYTTSKLAAEQALLDMVSSSFTPVIFRNATVFGYSPRPRLDSPANNFLYTAMQQHKVLIRSNGMAIRPIIHVSDLSRLFALALYARNEDVSAQVFNTGGTRSDVAGEMRTNFRLIDLAVEVARVVPGTEITTGIEHTLASYALDTSKSASVLGFAPRYSLHDGFIEMLDGYKDLQMLESNFYSNVFWMAGLIATGEIDIMTFRRTE